MQVFVHEKYWEGCNGLEVTDEMRVTIAGHACLMLLGFDEWCFDNLQTVLIYPDEYFARETTHLPGGVVAESMSMRLGEAWERGPVILAWSSVLRDIHPPQSPRRGRRSGTGRGQNVVLHEFAHVLDMQDLDADGTPPLASAGQYDDWQEVMTAEYNRLLADTERGRPTLLDEYGTVNPAEFFAVATECFFELPVLMQRRHPRLYELFVGFYRQDPARRMATVSRGIEDEG